MKQRNNMSVEFATVSDVADAGLCCFCGACEGVCPHGSVTLDTSGSFIRPRVNSDTCTSCGLCVEICPGRSVDFDSINKDFFGEPAADKIIGNYIETYVGAVTDQELRYRRTSGGLAKGIASWGLEKGLWQGVVVSKFRSESIRKTDVFIAKTPPEVESSASSLYCPVSVCSILKDLKDFKGKVCMIALPCQLHALRKVQDIFPWVREKVAFNIGLFCSSTPGFDATEAFLKYHGIDHKEVLLLKYRSEGWPGDISIRLKDGKKSYRFARGSADGFFNQLKFGAAFHRRGGFVCFRCLSCADYTAEFADVSLGDAWRLGYNDEKNGLNIVIVRSQKARELLDQLLLEEKVFLEKISRNQVVKSHRGSLLSKKKCGAMVHLLRKKNIALPFYAGQPEFDWNIWEGLVARMELAQRRLAGRKKLWFLLPLLVPLMSLLRRIAGRSKIRF